ncbi:MAG: hypothetical protein CVU89_07730 [Firmicutes bacterium HGW-Firmicutes-14]|nr:MAG: hypothetical protein CVU89_07730 [Firmicutes bacterium HGW-Firmicutes-14]
MHKRKPIWEIIKNSMFIIFGAILVSVALEIFLIPNLIIDGGIIGVAIILGYLTKIPIGLLIFFLNLPFLFIGYKQIGKTFTLSTFLGVSVLSIGVNFLHPVPELTDDLLLASVFGGIILGIGVGTIIRYGGSLDGTEIIAIITSKKGVFSVGEIVMFFNIFILGSAGFVFGWDRAMYSLITYFIAFKMIDITIDGLEESKSVMIVSENPEEIAEVIMARLGRGVTSIPAKGCYTKEDKKLLYVVVTRLELAKLRSIIHEIDDSAFVAIGNVHEVLGGRFRKRAIH